MKRPFGAFDYCCVLVLVLAGSATFACGGMTIGDSSAGEGDGDIPGEGDGGEWQAMQACTGDEPNDAIDVGASVSRETVLR